MTRLNSNISHKYLPSLQPGSKVPVGKANPVRFGEDKDAFSKTGPTDSSVSKYVELLAPNPTVVDSLPIDGTEVVVFDLETTGFYSKGDSKNPEALPDDMIEVSAIRYKDGVPLARYKSLVKPMKPIPDEVVALTNITNEMVEQEGRDQKLVLQELADFVGKNAVLIGHNARSFDVRFVRGVCTRLGLEPLKEHFNYDHVVDTLELSQAYFKKPSSSPAPQNMKLSTVASFWGFENKEAHRAESDVETAARLYYQFIQEIRHQGIQLDTFSDLFRYQFKKRKVKVEQTG